MSDPWYGATPRRCQVDAYAIGMNAIRARKRAVMQLCTGAGKTLLTRALVGTIAATLKPGWKLIVSVPTDALVGQTAKVLAASGVPVGMFYGRRKSTKEAVIVTCQPSMRALAEVQALDGWKVALWLADEMHRTDADTVQAAVEALAPWARLGITATPYTSAKDRGLRGWDDLVYTYGIDDATADGVLVPYTTHDIGGQDDRDANIATIDLIRQWGDGPGVVSATDIEDANWYAGILTEHGIPAMAVHSGAGRGCTHAQRGQRIEMLRTGQIRCVVHVNTLTEGVDLPWLVWSAFRAPVSSHVKIVQSLGRILRAHPGKTGARVLLPHRSPIFEAMSRDAQLGHIEQAKALQERAARELAPDDDAETGIKRAVPAVDGARIVATVADAVTRYGLPIEPARCQYPDAAPTVEQYRYLSGLLEDQRKSPVRYLPPSLRGDVRDLIRDPRHLRREDASVLIGALGSCRRKAGEHKRATGAWWKGIAA